MAKSIGCQTPSRLRDSHELKSQPKKALMVRVMSSSRDASSSLRKPSPMR